MVTKKLLLLFVCLYSLPLFAQKKVTISPRDEAHIKVLAAETIKNYIHSIDFLLNEEAYPDKSKGIVDLCINGAGKIFVDEHTIITDYTENNLGIQTAEEYLSGLSLVYKHKNENSAQYKLIKTGQLINDNSGHHIKVYYTENLNAMNLFNTNLKSKTRLCVADLVVVSEKGADMNKWHTYISQLDKYDSTQAFISKDDEWHIKNLAAKMAAVRGIGNDYKISCIKYGLEGLYMYMWYVGILDTVSANGEIKKTITHRQCMVLSIRKTNNAAIPWEAMITGVHPTQVVESLEDNCVIVDVDNVLVEYSKPQNEPIPSPARGLTNPTANADEEPLPAATNIALVIGTNNYKNWPHLDNPVYDAQTIRDELKQNYGYEVIYLENPDKNTILNKLYGIRRTFAQKVNANTNLLIFIAGHGGTDDFINGYLVPSNAANPDLDNIKQSYIAYSSLREIIDGIPAKHTLVMLDACYAGSFCEQNRDRVQNKDAEYADVGYVEVIKRHQHIKTRLCVTSGDKIPVPDGKKGSNSPFAYKFIELLRNSSFNKKCVNFYNICDAADRLPTPPFHGYFGGNQPASDFILVPKSLTR